MPKSSGAAIIAAMTNAAPLPLEPPALSAQRNLRRGIVLMVLGVLLLPGIDAVAKGLSGQLSAGQVAWARFFFQSVILLPFVLRAGGLRIRHRAWVHVARGVLLSAATLMFFSSLAVLPLADAIAIFFVEPLMLTVLSAVFLGEPVGWRRLLAVAVGFIGALIIIRPSFAAFGPTALLPLGTALAFALYLVLTRLLVVVESAVTLQFYAGVFGCLAMTGALLLGVAGDISVLTPALPSARQWLLLALLGLIATVGHQLVVLAIRRVGAGMVAPFQYMEIISATLLGMALFDEFPDTATWSGVGIIVGAGLYVYVRERHRAAGDDAAGEPPPV